MPCDRDESIGGIESSRRWSVVGEVFADSRASLPRSATNEGARTVHAYPSHASICGEVKLHDRRLDFSEHAAVARFDQHVVWRFRRHATFCLDFSAVPVGYLGIVELFPAGRAFLFYSTS
jgi:hypothetical protein